MAGVEASQAVVVRAAREQELVRLQGIESAAATRFREIPLSSAVTTEPQPLEVLTEACRARRLWTAAVGAEPVETEPVGFALAGREAGRAWLEEVDVLPAWGGHGIGRRLVLRVAAWARASGHEELWLTTFREVPWNAPWYTRLGFRVVPGGRQPAAVRRRMDEEAQRGLLAEERVAMSASVVTLLAGETKAPKEVLDGLDGVSELVPGGSEG